MNGFTSRIKKAAQIFRVLLSRRNTEKSERHNIYNMYSICCRYLGHGRSVSKTIGLLCLYQPLLHTVPRMWSPPLLLISLYQHRSGVAITKHQQNGCSCRICTAETRWQNTQGASSPSKFPQKVALPTEDRLSILIHQCRRDGRLDNQLDNILANLCQRDFSGMLGRNY